MAEIAEIPWNGFNAVSTFSGCGGSSLGYKMAGFKVLWANEFVPAARDTYAANHPTTILDPRDIRKVEAEDVLKAVGMKQGELDLLDGSPPCGSFSLSGSIDDHWGQVRKYSDTEQRSDDLFFEYARLVSGIMPKVFVAENVSGLSVGKSKGYFLDIMEAFKKAGYKVGAKLLDAKLLGVPQVRRRIIFQGVREDVGVEPAYPKPLPYAYTVGDAFAGLENQTIDPGSIMADDSDCRRWWFKVKAGDSFDTVVPSGWFNFYKLTPNKPAPTLMQGSFNLHHWEAPRRCTILELKRLQSFPDDFVLTGRFGQQWERLGRAVPPFMMRAVAETVRDQVLRKGRP